ncbi:amine dehydrogenase large subunit [Novosphingobium sp.]|uniref:amine dehydrogenase large subunit n=1 Tax=Novosphingobium sp. TaxID=1874826 RepID=UPI0038BAA1BC
MKLAAIVRQSAVRQAIARKSVASAALALAMLAAPAAHAATASVEPEESGVNTLEAPKASWFFVQRGFVLGGTSIYDSNTGKLLGQVETPVLGDMALDPAGKAYYVAQTIWTKRTRGTRQDMVTVYDAKTLNFQADIDIPGRMLVGGRKNNFVVSDDGKFAYVYNYNPATSVNVIDLTKRKFVKAVELPGCADLVTVAGVGLSALCNDGSIATIALAGAKPEITHTAPFFNATTDPVFDNYATDKAKKQSVLLTYTGLIYTVALGAKPVVGEPFSIQEAAGIRKGETKPLEVNWFPGGGQPLALHRPTGHLFVLMHPGEYWTHKDGATEVWEVDLATKKVVKRIAVPDLPEAVEVTQEAEPKLILAGGSDTLRVIDLKTGAIKYTIKEAGSGPITVVENP